MGLLALVLISSIKRPRFLTNSPLARAFAGHLNLYYDAVIACLRDVEAILMLGPGEAKVELDERLASQELGGRIVGIETVDKTTDRQIVEKFDNAF